MQVVNVKMQNGVFIPLGPVDYREGMEAVVIISGKIAKKTKKSVIDSQLKAKQYFKKNFPDLEVNANILDLVGILPESPDISDKNEYYEYLGRKYK